MGDRQRGQTRLGEQRDEPQSAPVDRPPNVGDVDLAAQDRGLLLVPVDAARLHGHLGVPFREVTDRVGEDQPGAKPDRQPPEYVAQTIGYLIADGYVSGTVAELNGGGNLV
jgi:hypothetical protein